MAYYSERHGLRPAISKTYVITPQMYALLLKCCEKYYNNIAWKYPEQCPDGAGCCGLDYAQFDADLKYEIPTLHRDNYGRIGIPEIHSLPWEEDAADEYDQYALLDYIEFFAQNCKDVDIRDYHSFFRHNHLVCKSSDSVFKAFQSDINDCFKKTGLLYQLNNKKQIERIIEDSPLTPKVEKELSQIKEKGTRELLAEAIQLHRQPYPESARDATEKIWDAFERLKTYYTTLDKKDSAAKIVNDVAGGNSNYADLFTAEFKALTTIGNNYRIRHHETDKVDIIDPRYYDYFFNRCLSLIALAIQFLK